MLRVGGGIAGIVLFCLGASYGWSLYALSKQRAVVDELRSQRTREQARLDHMEERFGDLKVQEADIQALQNAVGKTRGHLEETKAKLKALRPQWQSANSAMQSAVEAVRQAMETTPVPKVPGSKGEMLTNVKLKALRPGEVSLEHDAGMSRIAYKDLSVELADRLQVDWWPTLNLPSAPPDHESVTSFLTAFAIPPRPPVPIAPTGPVETALEVETRGYFETSTMALRTEISKLQLFIEDTSRQTEQLKKMEAMASNRDAKTLSLQRGMDAREAQRQLHTSRLNLEKQMQLARTRILRLQTDLKKLNK
jgi:uncharacterized coiled-coil protein SlyX